MAPIDIEEVRRRIEAAQLEAYQNQNPETENQEQDTTQNRDFVRPHLSAADLEVIKLLEVVRDIEWVTKDGEFQKTERQDWTFADSDHVLAAGGLRAALRAAGQTGVEFINAQPAAASATAQPAVAQPTATQPAAAQPAATQPAATQPAATQSAATQPAATQPAVAQAAAAQLEEAQPEDFEAEAQTNMQPEGMEMETVNFDEYVPDAPDPVVASQSQSPTPQPDPLGLCAYHIDDEDDYWKFRLTPATPRDD
ncbi:uncharacterized protein BO80DRAFT_443622 [Aspergillus ibericus CBS 121593]|uniref:Uncharacterized protein n=1 Tax=Aspergillus ibericus CBS 121593 TaxID=1448316 RepID=A0A395H376_9EURO|nr:hypothetical protein BO80DRAFT_443622 [Aspergillus ibericus CBS 121593]RAL02312.1 hypothetical protein BO80DRAFT_443622 [Aspergillus ibericus CBS 121593]